MAKASEAPKKGGQGSGGNGPASGKGPFSSIATQDDAAAFAVMELDDMFGRDISQEKRAKIFSDLKEEVSSSKLSPERKRMLLDYLKIAEREGGARFSALHADAIVYCYMRDLGSDVHLHMELSLMESWCSGKIVDFLKDQLKILSARDISEEERSKLNEMISLAISRKMDSMRALAASNIGIYYRELEAEKRIVKLDSLIRTFKAAHAAE